MIDLYARMDAIISEYAGHKVADVMAEASRRLRALEEEPSVIDISEKLRHAAETDAVENGESVRTMLLRDAAWIIDAYAVDVEALDQKCSALAVAHGPNTCGCSYDAPGDICAAHSPQLMAARARLEALEKAAAALAWRPLATAPKPKLGETWSPLFMVGRDGWPESVALARYNTALDGGHVLEIFYPNGVRRHEDAPFTHWRPVDYPLGDLRALARAAGEGEAK